LRVSSLWLRAFKLTISHSQKMQRRGVEALIEAVRKREKISQAIAQKQADMQREILNFAMTLNAVYIGRQRLAEDALNAEQAIPGEGLQKCENTKIPLSTAAQAHHTGA
jgi:hypothetical protein